MNERILELAEAALGPHGRKHGEWLMNNQELQFLVHSVARECMAICVSNALDDLDNLNPRGASAKCAFDIKEHFGVEE